MLVRSNGRPPRPERPQSPQLTLRVAVLGGIAVLLFTVLFFRLWVLQVLSGETFEAQANENRARTVTVHAPRGEILDREGRPLVVNRPGNAVTVDLAAMPELALACGNGTPAPIGAFAPAARPSVVNLDRRQAKRRLDRWRARNRKAHKAHKADVLRRRRAWAACVTPGAPAEAYDLSARQAKAADEDRLVLRRLWKLTDTRPYVFGLAIRRAYTRSRFEPVTLLDGVPHELIVFLKEHGTRYPGIRIRTRPVRQYPNRTLAAHLWGQLTEIDRERLEDQKRFPDAEPGDLVGNGGVEEAYDRWLRGENGRLAVRIDALGNPQGTPALQEAPVAGHDLRLTLDLDVQRAAERALREAFRIAKARGEQADAGAVVAMDARTGEIRAMASAPSFDPNRLIGKNAAAYYEQLTEDDEAARLLNRAVAGEYPAGSTFKPVTAVAGIQSRAMGVGDALACTPDFETHGHTYDNFVDTRNIAMDLVQALTESCDTWFYRVGAALYDRTAADGDPEPQADWGRRLGFGRPTGLDIPGERGGINPGVDFKREYAKQFTLRWQRLQENRWTPGDAVNTSIGQGHLLVTPLQIARLYAMIANGGTLVTPHVGLRVEQPGADTVVKRFAPAAERKVATDPGVLETIRAGLRGVTHDAAYGTGAQAFAGFPVGVAGKTGTAERPPDKDYAWFVGYAPLDDPQLVVVAMIEQGGFGGEVAAPAVRRVLATAFGVDETASSERRIPTDLRGRPIPPDATQMANVARLGTGITVESAAVEELRKERARRAEADVDLDPDVTPTPPPTDASDAPSTD